MLRLAPPRPPAPSPAVTGTAAAAASSAAPRCCRPALGSARLGWARHATARCQRPQPAAPRRANPGAGPSLRPADSPGSQWQPRGEPRPAPPRWHRDRRWPRGASPGCASRGSAVTPAPRASLCPPAVGTRRAPLPGERGDKTPKVPRVPGRPGCPRVGNATPPARNLKDGKRNPAAIPCIPHGSRTGTAAQQWGPSHGLHAVAGSQHSLPDRCTIKERFISQPSHRYHTCDRGEAQESRCLAHPQCPQEEFGGAAPSCRSPRRGRARLRAHLPSPSPRSVSHLTGTPGRSSTLPSSLMHGSTAIFSPPPAGSCLRSPSPPHRGPRVPELPRTLMAFPASLSKAGLIRGLAAAGSAT